MVLQMTGRLVPMTQGGADWLGDEPAIEVDGRRHTPDDRRRVSARWLSGTVLTGLSGALLISAAAYTALDQQTRFAEAPTRAQPAHAGDGDEQQTVNPMKGDRLMRAVDVVAAKQTFRAATTSRAGDKEVVRNRAFTRVAATLALAPSAFASEVPPYNPLKFIADARAPENAGEDEFAADRAEVSFETRDLATVAVKAQSARLTLAEAQAQVLEQVKSSLAAGPQSGAALPLPGQMLLTRTSRAAIDPLALAYAAPGGSLAAPFSGIEVRMVAENVTIAPRDTPQPTQMEEKLVIVKRGQTLADVLESGGVPQARIPDVAAAFKNKRGAPVREGQRVKLLFADFDGSGENMQLARMSVYNDESIESIVAATDKGAFVQTPTASSPQADNRRSKSRNEVEEDQGAMRLYDSLYETALKQQIPPPIINELVRVFANDVDLQRGVAGGDTLDVFYDEGEEGSNAGRDGLLYASLETRNETYRYYRFFTPDDGLLDYYDENGRSSRKFLVRKPIANGETRSGFGMRRHPILGYYKMHTGVDWAAPLGTPILAAGNGTVIKAQWDSGYGRRVEIQHANGYITTYNHMSGVARGVKEGVRVKQGQVIGFLGSTGLSTGPHLHYEVMVNGHFVDPMRVKLARTREIKGRLLADFKKERDRIDGLMAKAPNSDAKVAARQTK